MNPTNSPHFQRGVTLTELAIALAISIITLCLAAPGFSSFIRQAKVSSAAHELNNAITLTRTLAITRNDTVDLIAIKDDWKNGWIISGRDKQPILSHEPLHHEFKIHGGFSDGLQHIAYNGTGHSQSQASTNATQFGHIQLGLGEHTRIIKINFLGYAKICNPSQDKSCEADSFE